MRLQGLEQKTISLQAVINSFLLGLLLFSAVLTLNLRRRRRGFDLRRKKNSSRPRCDLRKILYYSMLWTSRFSFKVRFLSFIEYSNLGLFRSKFMFFLEICHRRMLCSQTQLRPIIKLSSGSKEVFWEFTHDLPMLCIKGDM